MEWIDDFLEERKEKALFRSLPKLKKKGKGKIEKEGQELVDFSSNNYLGLAEHPYLIERSKELLEKYGTSSSASRLLSGDLEINHFLEEKISSWRGKESALVFGSGFLANLGIISSLVGRKDLVLSDRLNHASILDGILLSQARFVRFRHNDCRHLEEILKKMRANFEKVLIVVESIYSMEGDRAPLKEIVYLKEKYNAFLLVDEAHATGIFGKKGAGLVEEENLEEKVDLIMGTFGKALGSYGAYLAASRKMVEYLINKARSLIYSTALPPAVIGANLAALELLEKEKERRRKLLEKAEYFRNTLKEKGFQIRGSSQIVPLLPGGNEKTIELANFLEKEGIFVRPIRYPTVPQGEERIRFSLCFDHSQATLEEVIGILEKWASLNF